MGGQRHDRDLASVQHPSTAPTRLAEIAAHRGDLHPLILSHPACYPQLREWIFRVNPAVRPMDPAVRPTMTTRPAMGAGTVPHPRRGRGGSRALLGCGGVAVVIAAIVGIAVVGGLIATGPTGDRSTSQAQPNTPQPSGRDDSLAAFEAERTRFYELYAQLETNPVAPLVADLLAFQRMESSIADPGLTDARVATYAADARGAREQLEQRIADAAIRRTNISGSVTEAIVDEAGQGFIDISWDAATACGTSERADEGRVTVGCTSEEPLGVHLAPEEQFGGDAIRRQIVLHELTHLYMRADSDAKGAAPSSAMLLLDQGYFQDSSEVFADCYALTYLDLWTLTLDGSDVGYGYVCTEEERQLMRTWAVEVHAPMP